MAKAYLYSLTDTWDNAATTFTAIKMNATDTASAATSMLIDLQVGGTSQFHVLKSGAVHTKRSNYNITNTNAAAVLVSNYSLTGSDATSMFDLAGTWNTSGTPTAIKLNMTDTASNASSLLMDLQVGGASRFKVTKSGEIVNSADLWINSNSLTNAGVFLGTGADVYFGRDAADTLAQRRGTNAQVQHVYATYTDASNYERLKVGYSSSAFRVQAEKAGTGAARSLVLGTNGTDRWTLDGSTGHFLAGADNAYDIGASGANRPRDFYLGRNATFGGYVWPSYLRIGSGGNEARLYSAGDGIATLYNAAENNWNRLQFGGTTSSFPALKRNSTALETKLADDSAYAPHAMQYLDVTDGITAPAAATGRARIYVDTADGDLKVVFADGTVKTIVTDT